MCDIYFYMLPQWQKGYSVSSLQFPLVIVIVVVFPIVVVVSVDVVVGNTSRRPSKYNT